MVDSKEDCASCAAACGCGCGCGCGYAGAGLAGRMSVNVAGAAWGDIRSYCLGRGQLGGNGNGGDKTAAAGCAGAGWGWCPCRVPAVWVITRRPHIDFATPNIPEGRPTLPATPCPAQSIRGGRDCDARQIQRSQ